MLLASILLISFRLFLMLLLYKYVNYAKAPEEQNQRRSEGLFVCLPTKIAFMKGFGLRYAAGLSGPEYPYRNYGAKVSVSPCRYQIVRKVIDSSGFTLLQRYFTCWY